MEILNLTQHPATEEQRKAGVVDLEGKELENLRMLITFDELPSPDHLKNVAEFLAMTVKNKGLKKAMIGGASYFMPVLHNTLICNGITPVFGFSKRNAVDKYVGDKIVTEYTFEHEGFIEL